MREKLKYFIINKAYDFNRGMFENMTVRDNSLCFSSKKNSGAGRFLSRMFDSGERGMSWHRLIVNAEDCEPETLRIKVYSTDRDTVKFNGGYITLAELSERDDLSLDERLEVLEQLNVTSASGVTDILLHNVSGRYLWVYAELFSSQGNAAKINNIMIYLPGGSWIDHMPAIYRSSDSDTHFLERYLGIFQTFYEELDSEIADIAYRFDPECAEADFLDWLAKWMHISDTRIWSEEQLRKLLPKAVGFYRSRGTKKSLSDLIELYTGKKSFIIEGADLSGLAEKGISEEELRRLAGAGPETVTVLVEPGHDIEIIRRIASEMLPVTAELNIVELDPYIFLGKHSYLGINSALGQYRPAVLDGHSRLTFSSLGGALDEGDGEAKSDSETK